MGLMASGLNGQNFAFNGYLPKDKKDRKKHIQFLENLSFKNKQTQIFIETPFRNNRIYANICRKYTVLVVAILAQSRTFQIVLKTEKKSSNLNKKPMVINIITGIV